MIAIDKLRQIPIPISNSDLKVEKTALSTVFAQREGSYINELMLFVAHFNTIPNFINEIDINCIKACEWFADNYKDDIKNLYYDRIYFRQKKQAQYDDVFFFIYEDLIVDFDIQHDGKRIDLHHLGIRKSEPARKEIEKMFGLVVADAHARREAFKLKPVEVKTVLYGRTETKRAITNVLDTVLLNYKYASLPELNAALKQYNIMADRGGEESRIFKSGGLVYRVLDENGKPIGVPIKASDFYSKPTLKFLEERYSSNDALRQPFKARVKNEIDRLFISKKPRLDELVTHLQRKGIHVALRQTDTGFIYGITYVDHQTKCVFNGSALGKQYSAKALQERCLPQELLQQNLPSQPAAKQGIGLQPNAIATAETKVSDNAFQSDSKGNESIFDALLQSEQAADYVPGQLKKKGRKKKKRKNISNNQ